MISDRVENCPMCDGDARVTTEVRAVTIGTRTVDVEDEFMRCQACGEELYRPDQMDATQRRAVAKIRDEDGLLAPEAIKRIRRNYDVTQVELEAILGTGPKTVVRWERGTVCQGRAVDTLLRTLDAFPFAFWWWAEQRGVKFNLPFGEKKWDSGTISVRSDASLSVDIDTANWEINKLKRVFSDTDITVPVK